jgi:hypothetical protein
VRKTKEVLRLRFEVGLGLRPVVVRSASEPSTTICSEQKQPELHGRWARIGVKTGWRLPCSAAHHGFARRRW